MRHNRTVKIKKADLIAKLNENKNNHIKEYDEAVIAYKEEALSQLKKLTKEVNNGKLDIGLSLVTPINRVDEYDKVIDMFAWEVDDMVELTQSEFNEYVHDETDSAKSAKFSNSFYSSKSL